MQGARSFWAPFLAALPERTLSPILWSDEELEALKGSPVAAEAAARRSALQSEWAALGERVAAEPSLYPAGALAIPYSSRRCTLLAPVLSCRLRVP